MKFLKAEDTKYYFERLVSEDGKIFLGIHPVMFGFRVRGGYIEDEWGCAIDWCGGDDQTLVEMLYSIAKNILENQGSFLDLPTASKIKPFFNDKDFVELINSKVTKPLEPVRLQHLQIYKLKMLNNL